MKTKKHSFASDAAFICMLALMFICVIFTSFYSEYKTLDIVLFTVVCLAAMITYFTSLTAGLVIDIVLIFAGTSFLLYRFLIQGLEPVISSYFWIVMLPLITLSVGIMVRGKNIIENENSELSKELESFSTIDSLTGLKNLRAYENDALKYLSIAQRSKVSMALLVVEYRYAGDLQAFIGDEKLKKISVRMSELISHTLREGDVVYMLSKAPYRWGALLLLMPDTSAIVTDRLRERVNNEDFLEDKESRLEAEIRIGAGEWETGESPSKLLERAVNNMQYDV